MNDDLDIKTFFYELSFSLKIFLQRAVNFIRTGVSNLIFPIQYEEFLKRSFSKFVSRNLYACFTSFVSLMNGLNNVKNRNNSFETTRFRNNSRLNKFERNKNSLFLFKIKILFNTFLLRKA